MCGGLSDTLRKLTCTQEFAFLAPPLFAVAEIENGQTGGFEGQDDLGPIVAILQHVPTEIILL